MFAFRRRIFTCGYFPLGTNILSPIVYSFVNTVHCDKPDVIKEMLCDKKVDMNGLSNI